MLLWLWHGPQEKEKKQNKKGKTKQVKLILIIYFILINEHICNITITACNQYKNINDVLHSFFLLGLPNWHLCPARVSVLSASYRKEFLGWGTPAHTVKSCPSRGTPPGSLSLSLSLFFFFFFLQLHQQRMEIPRLELESEL